MATTPEALAIAAEHHQAGRLHAAEPIYRQVLAAEPNQPDALHLLGVLVHQMGKPEVAVAYIERAIRLHATNGAFHNDLGNAFAALGKLDEAVARYRRALELLPEVAEAHCNLSNALYAQGKLDQAAASCRRALELKPEFAEAHNNLGNVFKDQQKPDEAIACYQRALELKPDNVAAHNNLGNVHKDQNNFAEAQRCYEHAVSLNPRYGLGLNNLGNVYREQGRMHQARDCFQRSYAVAPNDGLRIKRALVMPVVLESAEQMHTERRRLQQEIRELLAGPLQLPDPVTKIGMTVFYPAYHGFNDCELHEEIAQVCLRATPALEFTAPHCREGAAAPPAGRIKIGFVSKFFNEHTITKLNAGIMRNLARDRFEVFAFRFPAPKTPGPRPCARAPIIRSFCRR